MTTSYDDEPGSPLAVARTRDEAMLYLELRPCEDCGTVGTAWEHGLEEAGGELAASYVTECRGCGAEREYVFALPSRETPAEDFPVFGGPEPSELLDPGEWLAIADRSAAVSEDDPGPALAVARAAVEEVLKFVPPGREAVPPDAFWTEAGKTVYDEDPGRFCVDRLLVVRDSYFEQE